MILTKTYQTTENKMWNTEHFLAWTERTFDNCDPPPPSKKWFSNIMQLSPPSSGEKTIRECCKFHNGDKDFAGLLWSKKSIKCISKIRRWFIWFIHVKHAWYIYLLGKDKKIFFTWACLSLVSEPPPVNVAPQPGKEKRLFMAMDHLNSWQNTRHNRSSFFF